MNILVVDDDPMILRLAHDILRASGHDVSVAKDGEVAWQSIRRRPPDLLLTDWLMPPVDGPELIARLRTEAAHREIYIIILSSRTAGDGIADGLEMGAHDYITKPFTARELSARIALADRTQRLARAAEEPLPSSTSSTHRQVSRSNYRPRASRSSTARCSTNCASWTLEAAASC